jgi:hypothetical protein
MRRSKSLGHRQPVGIGNVAYWMLTLSLMVLLNGCATEDPEDIEFFNHGWLRPNAPRKQFATAPPSEEASAAAAAADAPKRYGR